MPYFINLIFFLKTRKAAFKKADKIFLFVIFFACAKKITKRNALLSLFTQRKEAKKGNDCIIDSEKSRKVLSQNCTETCLQPAFSA